MEPGKASTTALGAATRRAIHQLADEPLVFSDPVAVELVEAARPGFLQTYLETLSRPEMKNSRNSWVLRSRFAEDELALAVAHGVHQYVILGAGLDTFAYRQPPYAADVSIFEVDHPATQAWKRDALAKAGLAVPANLSWAPVDFEHETLAEGLTAVGFDRTQPSFIAWLGVTQYLTRPAIEDTLRYVAALPASSTIVLTFTVPLELLTGADRERTQESYRMNAARGEPFLTSFAPDELTELLRNLGFMSVTHLTPETATARYFAGRTDGMVAPRVERLVCATV